MALNKEYQKSIEHAQMRTMNERVLFLVSEQEFPAIVKQRGGKFKSHGALAEIELADNQYILDFYEDGIERDDYGNITNQPTRRNVLSVCVVKGDERAVDSQVTATLFQQEGYIRPWRIPSASGFSKVFMLVDDLNPGTWNADYVRFAAPAPKS